MTSPAGRPVSHARTTPTRVAVASAVFTAIAPACAPVIGQTASVVPTFSISESITDNRDLRSTDKQAEAITTISPGVRISSRSGRVQGTLDYSLNALVYARESSRNAVQHALAASFLAEVVENHAFVDTRASISQQSISAFGVQSPSFTTSNANRTEVRTLTVSPFLRGKLGDLADLDARATWGVTSSGGSRAADSSNTSISLRASGGRGPIGWSTSVSESTSDFDGGRKTKQGHSDFSVSYRLNSEYRANVRIARDSNDILATQQQYTTSRGGGLDWTPNPDLRASVRVARETTDGGLTPQPDRTTWGGGLNWAPTPRTNISVESDRRFFGNSRNISFQHRMARSVWRFSDTRNISTNLTGNPGFGVLDSYDQLFAQYAIAIPDPVLRDLFVRALLASRPGFLTNAVSVQHSRNATVLLQGVRTNISFNVFATDSRRLDGASGASDDLSLGGTVRQHGHSVTVSYQLAPVTGINFGYNRSVTDGIGTQLGNGQRSFTLSMSTQLFYQRTSLSLSLRHVVFDSAVQPYTENGATATLSVRF